MRKHYLSVFRFTLCFPLAFVLEVSVEGWQLFIQLFLSLSYSRKELRLLAKLVVKVRNGKKKRKKNKVQT